MGSTSRRVARLTLDNLDDLPAGYRSCVFWELDPVRRAQVVRAGRGAAEKQAWVSGVLLEWGSCGRVLYVDDRAVGLSVYAPGRFLPGADSFASAPVSDDAVLLASLGVLPDHTGGGLGRLLVQSVVKDVLHRGVRALEVFGDRSPGATGGLLGATGGLPGEGPCVLPADFWLRVGFKTYRQHPRYPRLRMDMRSVLTWRDEVEQALEKILRAVRPRPVAPAAERSAAERAAAERAGARPRGSLGQASGRPSRSAARRSASRSTPVFRSASGVR